MQTVRVELGERSYPVYIGPGLLARLGSLYRQHPLEGRAFVVTDETVAARYGEIALRGLKDNEIEAVAVAVPPGEASKSLEMADRLYGRLIRTGFDRDGVVVALGGGVVGDLAGFVAATFLRGVPWVQVPTTLLAQADSSVGGKTAVNHRLGKNMIGAFHQPTFVLADTETLHTLPEAERRAGAAEAIKYGLIADRAFFEEVERCLEGVIAGAGGEALERVIWRCVQIKAEVVARDEREAGGRRILNFGHTLAHALEALTGYETFRHGEAVAWGMLGEAFISYRYGPLPEMDFVRIRRLLGRLRLPPLPTLDRRKFLELLRRDKKSQRGTVHGVWLKHIGEAFIQPLREEEVLEALSFWAGSSR